MKIVRGFSMFVLVFCLWPTMASAQGLDVGLSGTGLVSVQPADDGNGGVYLDVNIAAVRPGFGIGVNVIAPSGFVVAAEFSRADFEGTVSGRSINGSGADQGRVREARLNSTLVSGLLGYGIIRGRSRVVLLLLLGAGADLFPFRLDGGPNDFDPSPMVTGGIDFLQTLSARATLVVTGRYSNLRRDVFLGPHVIRAGAGLRIRLN